jgi:hypothetical protein
VASETPYASVAVDPKKNATHGYLNPWCLFVENGYITISQVAGEGTAIGNIAIGGAQFTVRVVEKPCIADGDAHGRARLLALVGVAVDVRAGRGIIVV